jgi:hypothetical protein
MRIKIYGKFRHGEPSGRRIEPLWRQGEPGEPPWCIGEPPRRHEYASIFLQ